MARKTKAATQEILKDLRPPPPEADSEGKGSNSFRYRIGGKLVPVPWPFSLEDLEPGVLGPNGVVEIQKFGQEAGIQLRILERQDDDAMEHDPRWWLVIDVHPDYCCIEVTGWPARLDALNRYAPMVNMDSADWIRGVAEQYEKEDLACQRFVRDGRR